MVAVLFAITGVGLTVTVVVNAEPEHKAEEGVTVYTTLVGVFIELVKV